MRRVHHLNSTAQALFNIFVYAPRPRSQISCISTNSAPPRWRCTTSALRLRHVQIRRYADVHGSSDARRPVDREITASLIYLKQADGTLGPPSATSHVLQTFNRSLYHLVQLSPSLPGRPTVCQIISKQALRDMERAKEQVMRKPAVTAKQLEMSWAIDSNDLSHRLKKMQEFLGQGRSVEIILARKRKGKGRQATSEEANALIKTIRAKAMEVEGAKESKHMEGKVLEQVTLFFGGKVVKGEAKS